MIAYFILGVCLLVGFILLARWFVMAEPRKVLAGARWAAAGLGLIAAGFLLWGGRHALALLAIPFLLPLLRNYRAIWNRIKAAQGPTPGQSSVIDTRFIRMTLEHDTGVMDGVVMEGRFSGRRLEQMALPELIELWRECVAGDAQSAAVLEAFLDRTEGEDWREGAEPGAASGGVMTRDEAYEILGLEPSADAEEIHDAHRRLMQKVHPDHGGSNYLAAQINQAKELLLGE